MLELKKWTEVIKCFFISTLKLSCITGSYKNKVQVQRSKIWLFMKYFVRFISKKIQMWLHKWFGPIVWEMVVGEIDYKFPVRHKKCLCPEISPNCVKGQKFIEFLEKSHGTSSSISFFHIDVPYITVDYFHWHSEIVGPNQSPFFYNLWSSFEMANS